MMRLLVLLAALALAPGAASGQPVPAPVSAAAAQDETAVRNALDAFDTGGYAALAPHIPAVEAALAHSPARYPKIERRGKTTIIRPLTREEALILSLMAGERYPDSKPVTAFNIYGTASFLLGSYLNETGRHEDALKALDRGLALQPDEAKLLTEKGAALTQLKHFAEVLALYDPWLAADDDAASDTDRARVYRGKGFALIELGRLDEAEAAYRQALALEPGHAGALREIAYIQGLRAGRPVQPSTMTTGEKAREGDY